MSKHMSLEQIRNELRTQAEFARGSGWPMTRTRCLAMADAIDAYLKCPPGVDVESIKEVAEVLQKEHFYQSASRLYQAIDGAFPAREGAA